MTHDLEKFYAGLTPLYHLIYLNWDESIERQAAMLDSIIRERWGNIYLPAAMGPTTNAP